MIDAFTLDRDNATLTIDHSDLSSEALSFEFLRVFAPNIPAKEIVSNKKMVSLLAIEPVSYHGYRLLFDDGHQAVYSESLLLTMVKEKEQLWQDYIEQLTEKGLSREATIDIKSL